MAEIFGNASRVIAYLGTSQHVSLANNFLARAIWHGVGVGIPSVEVDGSYDVDVPFQIDSDGWCAFRELIDNDFWTRAWILQEVVLAQKLVIFNGNSIFPWPFLYNFDKMFKGYSTKTPYLKATGRVSGQQLFTEADIFRTHRLMLEYRRAGESEQQKLVKSMDLAELLVDLRNFKATFPEDKVNAVLGITTYPYLYSLRPNHKNTVAEVYQSATLESLKSGSFLLFSISGLCYKRDLLLPSWVPDLNTSPWRINADGYEIYKAGTCPNQYRNIRNNGPELQLFGHIIDEVKSCGSQGMEPANYPFNLTAEDIKARQDEFYTIDSLRSAPGQVYRRLLEITAMLKTSSSLKDFETVTALTAVQNFDGEMFPATHDMLRSYVDFMKLMVLLQNQARPGPQTVLGRFQKSRKVENAKTKLLWTEFFKRAEPVFRNRNFALTHDGHSAMVPKGTRKGDVLCVFEGSPVPHVLRPARDGCCNLYGDAYVHNFMDGAALDLEGGWIILV